MRRTTIVIAALAVIVSACGSDSGQEAAASGGDCTPVVEGVETVDSGMLTAAVAEYPPYVSMASGSLSGVDGTVIARVAEALCLEASGQTMSFPAIVEAVKQGQADLSAGNWYINEERAESFELSSPVYLDQMAFISPDGASTLEELEGKSVGTTQGYLWVEDLQAELGEDNVGLYASEDAVYQDVRAGRIDAGVITYGGGSFLLTSNDDDSLELEVFASDPRIGASVGARTAVLVHKGNTSLRDAVDLVVAEMRDSGALADALEGAGIDPSAAEVGSE